MRREDELILLCARARLDSADTIRQIAASDLDWDYVLEAAQRHGVVPLLCTGLHAACRQAVPVLQELDDRYLRNTQRNLLLVRELLAIVKLLSAKRIPVIPFKGPVLALTAYGNLSLRQIRDLDFIIHPEDATRARGLLLAEGYRLVQAFDPMQEIIHIRSNCEFTFEKTPVELDIHWQISPRYFNLPFDLPRAWTRLEPVVLSGTSVPSLCPQDLLPVLCAHGARHVWERLEWLCSVSELIRSHPGLNWEVILKEAKEIGAERILLLGLYLAQQLLGTQLPERVTREMQLDPALDGLAARARERLFSPAYDEGIFEGTYVDDLHPRLFRRRKYRMLYYLHLFFTPTVSDTVWLRLPASLTFAYYVLRPVRLLARFVPRLWSRRMAGGTVRASARVQTS